MLPSLYDRVVVPRIVYDEVVVAGAGLPGSAQVAAAEWIEVQDAEPDGELVKSLDRGEAAAIPLAMVLGATLLCDDADARTEARRRHLVVIGTLGVLLLAKDRGLVTLIEPIVTNMRSAGMYVAESLLHEVLEAAGEADASQRQ